MAWTVEFQTIDEGSWRRASLFTGIPSRDTTLVPTMDLSDILQLLQKNQPNGTRPISLQQIIMGFTYHTMYCPERIRLRNIETGEIIPYVGLFS